MYYIILKCANDILRALSLSISLCNLIALFMAALSDFMTAQQHTNKRSTIQNDDNYDEEISSTWRLNE